MGEETSRYIKDNTNLSVIPEWMPRKPLLCQLLARLDEAEVRRLELDADGEVNFFESVFDAICQRETKIHPSISKDVLKGILLKLAEGTREKSLAEESLTTAEINQAFLDVTGYSPIDESAVLLQRLPYLGRIGTGGSERIFVDDYAKDGLRGIALSNCFQSQTKRIASVKWRQPLDEFGVRLLSYNISGDPQAEKYVKYCLSHGNYQIACDYIAVRLLESSSECNFNKLTVVGGFMSHLNLADCRLSNLHLTGVEVRRLTIESTEFQNVTVEHCTFDLVIGVGSAEKIPQVFRDCEFGRFDDAANVSRISELGLSDAQKTLLAIIKKLFFQPGAGRQEEALLRGAERYWNSDSAAVAIQYMESNGIVLRTKGNQGTLYVPRRKYMKRMAKIWELRSNCKDELWDRVSRIEH